jgi:Na+-translocating ferredoxin:NAD+ oxidoreductase RnfD subunit
MSNSSADLSAAAPAAPPGPALAPRAASPGELVHGGITITYFHAALLQAIALPLAAGVMMFGWRAAAAIGLVVLPAVSAAWLWEASIGWHRRRAMLHILTLSLLTAMALPAEWAGGTYTGANRPYHLTPLLPAVGLLVTLLSAALDRVGTGRLNAGLLTIVLVALLFDPAMAPTRVLQRQHIIRGDLLNAVDVRAQPRQTPWFVPPTTPADHARLQELAGGEAMLLDPAARRLLEYTRGSQAPERSWMSVETLLRDRLPPLDDFIVGGHPAPLGQGAAVAVIVGGLLLIYRGIVDWRVPVVTLAAAFVALVVLPVPVVITETGPNYEWVASRVRGVGWDVGITLANYELLAGPLMFVAFFLAGLPSMRPLNRRARVLHGLLIGVGAAAMQLYVSVSFGPYVALLIATLLIPLWDRRPGVKPLI